MAERRVVLDTSVIVPAFFSEKAENGADLSDRAEKIYAAISCDPEIKVYAPHTLIYEFFHVARRRTKLESAFLEICGRFLEWRIEFVPFKDYWAENALVYIEHHRAPITDVWNLMCAMEYHAEFWISHRQADGIVDAACELHDHGVFLLCDCTFDAPKPAYG